MKEYWVMLGSFGGGKSEMSLNMAVRAAAKGKCTLIDLDVINPYFRSSERGDVLDAAGVELISPPYALKKIEILSVSPRVYETKPYRIAPSPRAVSACSGVSCCNDAVCVRRQRRHYAGRNFPYDCGCDCGKDRGECEQHNHSGRPPAAGAYGGVVRSCAEPVRRRDAGPTRPAGTAG